MFFLLCQNNIQMWLLMESWMLKMMKSCCQFPPILIWNQLRNMLHNLLQVIAKNCFIPFGQLFFLDVFPSLSEQYPDVVVDGILDVEDDEILLPISTNLDLESTPKHAPQPVAGNCQKLFLYLFGELYFRCSSFFVRTGGGRCPPYPCPSYTFPR